MVPPWPFKKKSKESEESPAPVAYELGDDSSAKALADKSHVENNDFKAAMAALSTPHLNTETPVINDRVFKVKTMFQFMYNLQMDIGI